jgi:hypothetical protein
MGRSWISSFFSDDRRFVPSVKNQLPRVSAGPDQIVTLPGSASLNGTVTDDGLWKSPATLTMTWSKISGPGTVTFGNANAVHTTATFGKTGTYVLRLRASDGVLQTFDDVKVTVNRSDFSIVVLPDTQYYTRDFSPIFSAQTQWIVNNRVQKNVVYVAHLGALVENVDLISEWEHADAAMSLLENPNSTGLLHGIPYGIAVGNREQNPAGNPDGNNTQLYNTYFGEGRFLEEATTAGISAPTTIRSLAPAEWTSL